MLSITTPSLIIFLISKTLLLPHHSNNNHVHHPLITISSNPSFFYFHGQIQNLSFSMLFSLFPCLPIFSHQTLQCFCLKHQEEEEQNYYHKLFFMAKDSIHQEIILQNGAVWSFNSLSPCSLFQGQVKVNSSS